MKIQHPNFCRQLLMSDSPILDKGMDDIDYKLIRSIAFSATKFKLPEGGRLLDDPEFRGLDETQELHLPFPSVSLEFFAHLTDEDRLHDDHSSKRIMLVEESEQALMVYPVWWLDCFKRWVAYCPFSIPRVGYLDRTKKVHGNVPIAITARAGMSMDGLSDDVGCVLSFLNALQCSNVKIERSPTKPGNVKAFPFDSYHVLTIEVAGESQSASGSGQGGSHRSPREHLRRGHIRRLESGRKIWVNAAVIGAGKGVGKITKDYAVQ